MAIRQWAASPKVYLSMLIIAIALLLFIGSISYKQIDRLGRSADAVNRTMGVHVQINQLFSFYAQMQSSELKNHLLNDTLGLGASSTLMPKALDAFNRLQHATRNKPKQQQILIQVQHWQDSLFQSLEKGGGTPHPDSQGDAQEKARMIKVSEALTQLNLLKNQMYRAEQAQLAKSKEDYASQISFTPITTLFLGVFALFIFVIAFVQINYLRKKTVKAEKFLQKVLDSNGNIISYFTPIQNDAGEIRDFEIVFTNENKKTFPHRGPVNQNDPSQSELIPLHLKNKIFNELTTVIREGTTMNFEKTFESHGNTRWFSITATAMDHGVLTTSIDNTAQKISSRHLETLNEQLQIQNSILNDAEQVAASGSYRFDIPTKTLTISTNLYRLLDCAVGEFDPTLDNFKTFVHPSDLPLFNKRLSRVLHYRNIHNFIYRIIGKTGKIKYLQHSGHFIQNEFIGALKDITKELRDAQKIKDKNLELKRSNNELKSFNHVVSHDLQEPLRKIQIFISRIMEDDPESLSEKNRTYLDKINSSANRMQVLIKNLLAYSRLGKEDKTFVVVDLNEISSKVLEDLDAQIKDKNMEIIVQGLPKLMAISFQMEQLFTNLLSNAIKYSSTLARPLIKIQCQKIMGKAITDNFPKKERAYYLISVQDNGIGFDLANADKIFELFQRLHQKEEYSGTGIGLAICKKIVENHNGHILVESEVNIGTTFRIYLPT